MAREFELDERRFETSVVRTATSPHNTGVLEAVRLLRECLYVCACLRVCMMFVFMCVYMCIYVCVEGGGKCVNVS